MTNWAQLMESAARAVLVEGVPILTAEEIVAFLAYEFNCRHSLIADHLASIPHAEWVALAMSDKVTP